MYTVKIPHSVRKAIKRLSHRDRGRILARLRALAQDPRPAGCQPVKTAPKGTYRVRVGGYRIVYAVEDDVLLVVVVRVARRGKGTYRGL